MANNAQLQPLSSNFKIVGPDGFPTEYFIRWAQQRQIDIQNGITAAQAEQLIVDYLAAHELQAGAHITLAPSGNLSDNPTISWAADLGDLSDVDLVTAPPTDGQVLKYDAATMTWVPGTGGGGGGGGTIKWFAPPLASDFTVNANGTLIDTDTGLVMQDVVGGANSVRVTRAMRPINDAAPFKVVARISNLGSNYNANLSGVCVRDSATGRMVSLHYYFGTGGGRMEFCYWNSDGSFAGVYQSLNRNTAEGIEIFYSLESDGTNLMAKFGLGPQALHLMQGADTQGLNSWCANIDEIGLFMDNETALLAQQLVTWYSDTTLPPRYPSGGGGGGGGGGLFDISMGIPAGMAQIGITPALAFSQNGTKGANVKIVSSVGGLGNPHLGGFLVPVPATPTWEVAALMMHNNGPNRYFSMCFGFRNSGSGRILAANHFSGLYQALEIGRYNNENSRSSIPFTGAALTEGTQAWLHAKYDGTTLFLGCSRDGANPTYYWGETPGTWVGAPDEIFMGGQFENDVWNSGIGVSIYCYDPNAAVRVVGA